MPNVSPITPKGTAVQSRPCFIIATSRQSSQKVWRVWCKDDWSKRKRRRRNAPAQEGPLVWRGLVEK